MKTKVLCLGRSAKELEVVDGTTVEQAIQQAEYPTDGHYSHHVNGHPVYDTDVLRENDTLTLVPQVKGGSGDARTFNSLLDFHRQKHHVPIFSACDKFILKEWDKDSILIICADDEEPFWEDMEGEMVNDEAIVGENFIIFLNGPDTKIADKYIPILARNYIKKHRKVFMDSIVTAASDIKQQREYDLDRKNNRMEEISSEMRKLSKERFVDRLMIERFSKPEEFLRGFGMRMYRDLKQMVPSLYESIRFHQYWIIGKTHSFTISYLGNDYHFAPFEIRFELSNGRVTITGNDNNVNDYCHPHINYNGTCCWGNIGPTVDQLAGQYDIPGLFRPLHQFVSSYNADDPFQKIEYWDLDYEPEDDSYCNTCEESGHNTGDCEWYYWCEDCDEYHESDMVCQREVVNEAA